MQVIGKQLVGHLLLGAQLVHLLSDAQGAYLLIAMKRLNLPSVAGDF